MTILCAESMTYAISYFIVVVPYKLSGVERVESRDAVL